MSITLHNEELHKYANCQFAIDKARDSHCTKRVKHADIQPKYLKRTDYLEDPSCNGSTQVNES